MTDAAMETITPERVSMLFPPRKRDAHKGDFGRLLCITGSENMPGACLLSTQSALRCGAGLVTVATAKGNITRLCAAVPEAMWLPLKTDENGFALGRENFDALAGKLAQSDAVLIGCGMGTGAGTAALVRFVLDTASCPVILDADALNVLAGHLDEIDWRRVPCILTPHPGEMARLSGIDTRAVQADRVKTAADFAARYPVTLVLKGAGTRIAQGDRIAQNPTGNPGMARGGSGDVLAGMISAFAARGLPPFDASCAGVYLHGLAGDLAARRYAQEAMLPHDLIACIPAAFRAVLS